MIWKTYGKTYRSGKAIRKPMDSQVISSLPWVNVQALTRTRCRQLPQQPGSSWPWQQGQRKASGDHGTMEWIIYSGYKWKYIQYVYIYMYVWMYACMHACMCMCMCICISICICICNMYMYMYIYRCVYVCKYVCIYIYVYMYIYIYICICIYIYICVCIYMYMCVFVSI